MEVLNYSSLSDSEYKIPRATEIASKLVIMDTDKKFGVITKSSLCNIITKSQRLLLWTNCELSAAFCFGLVFCFFFFSFLGKAVQSLHHFQKWEVGSCSCWDTTSRSLWCLWKFYSNLDLNLSFLLAHSTPQSLHVSIILILKILMHLVEVLLCHI